MSHREVLFVKLARADRKHFPNFLHPGHRVVLDHLVPNLFRGSVDGEVPDVFGAFLTNIRFEGRGKSFHQLILEMLGPFVGIVLLVPSVEGPEVARCQKFDHA